MRALLFAAVRFCLVLVAEPDMRLARLTRILGLVHAVLLVVPLGSAFAHITFERTYGDTAYDHGRSVEQTRDGGYVIVGWTDSFGAVVTDVYLVKTDSLGDKLWSRTYGGEDTELGYSIVETKDGGFVIAGDLRKPSSGVRDIYLIRTDSAGDTVWTRCYGGADRESGRSVRGTQDGGFIVAGYSSESMWDDADVYLLKTDSLGEMIWTRTYGGEGNDAAYSVQQTSDEGYIIAGYSQTDRRQVYLLRTDSEGNVIWSQAYGGSGWDEGFSVDQTFDRGYVVTGSTLSNEALLIKVNSSGDSLWSRVYPGGLWGYSVRQTTDEGYIIAGTMEGLAGDWYDLYLLKTDSVGDTVWSRRYGGSQPDGAACVRQTRDGGYIVAGVTESFGAGDRDVYLIKTGPVGTFEWRDAGVVCIALPPDTVFVGSTQTVVANVHNFGNEEASFTVVSTIDGYSDTVAVTDLSSNSMTQRTFRNWEVPPGDSATYAMTVCAYLPGDMNAGNDCVQKSIFACNPVSVSERLRSGADAVAFSLSLNQKNPSGRSPLITYYLPETCRVTLEVYDISGRVVKRLVGGEREAGTHVVLWDINGNPSGVYLCRIEAGEIRETVKFILLR
jgi:hypothetical protein